MKTPGEYAAYFQTLAEAHIQIQRFFDGDYDDILAAERSTMAYPLLWLESPEISVPEDEDGFMLHYDGAFVLMFNSALDDTARRKTNMESAFRIAYDIVMKMLLDSQNHIFNFSIKNLRMDPVATINNDNDHGWRVTFTMSAQTEGCGNVDVWSKSIPTNIFARFELSDYTSPVMTFVNTSNLDDTEIEPDIFWNIIEIIAGEKVVTAIQDQDEIEIAISKGWESAYIQLTLDFGGYQKFASMYLGSSTPVEGTQSVPFIYNPIL